MAGGTTAHGGGVPASPAAWLVCFAVKEEAAYFVAPGRLIASTAVVITGMGVRNAFDAIETALERWRPQSVITAGFAGGLHPALKRGTVVFDVDDALGIATRLKELDAQPAVFHCAPRIAVTAAEKSELRQQTGADAVEMESAVIRAACRQAGVPGGTIRVISDAAHDELPLDFNALMTAAEQIDWWRFARALALKPTVLPRLIAFRRQTRVAARALGRVLSEVTRLPPLCSSR